MRLVAGNYAWDASRNRFCGFSNFFENFLIKLLKSLSRYYCLELGDWKVIIQLYLLLWKYLINKIFFPSFIYYSFSITYFNKFNK